MKTLPLACLTILTCFAGATATFAADTPSTADKTFVMKAAQGGLAEVQLGKLASEKGTAPEVKDFGTKMVTDHSANNQELASLATTKSITVPDKTDTKHQALIDKLDKMAAGKDWDKVYVDAMVTGHEKMDTLMSKEASSGSDPDLKSFASKTDETVKMHLSMAKDIQSKTK
jgi:putative membrane protein